MPSKKQASLLSPPVPALPPDLEKRPNARDGMAFINAQCAKIEAMLTILMVKAGISDGERIDHEAMAKFIEEQGKTYEEHSSRELQSEIGVWTCACNACGVFRAVKIREIFGYMREAQQSFDERWDELGRIAREKDAMFESWGILARLSPGTEQSTVATFEASCKEALDSRRKMMEMLGKELRLLVAPLRRVTTQ